MTNKESKLNIATFNCKNINTCQTVLDDLAKTVDILLIQEHWLFDCNLHKLKSLNSFYTGCGKAVDTGNPLLPVQMPRGYGGTAILWKHDIDHLIQTLPDGGNRIQCVELKGIQPLLLISAYMPCRGLLDNIEDYSDCLDQLSEIVTKYSSTHKIILGGDMNEDIVNRGQSVRSQLLKEFLNCSNLDTRDTEKTYINPDGSLVYTLDYIFYSEDLVDNVEQVKTLEGLYTNVSDHIPVVCEVHYQLDKIDTASKNVNLQSSSKILWKKLDHERYNKNLSRTLENINTEIDSMSTLDNAVRDLNNALTECAKAAAPKPKSRPRKAKLKVWTSEVKEAVEAKKKAFFAWKSAGRPQNKTDRTVINKKQTTILLRQVCRREISNKMIEERQSIMDSKSSDMALFHKLVNKQRDRLSSYINELHVGNSTYRSEQDILSGWHQHFKTLATPSDESYFDSKYKELVNMELQEIRSICQDSCTDLNPITEKEVLVAIKSLNKGKSADIYNVCAEHLVYGANTIAPILTLLLNKMFEFGMVPESLKLGFLTPVFKRKGSNLDAKNYRGITVTPILSKVMEAVVRERIKPIILEQQNKLQRGFTESSSPMNCSLIIEESIRENKDLNLPTYIAFLDAKSAFDVVNHASLLRKLFHFGVEGQCWNIVDSLHSNAETVVKWDGKFSDRFELHQGVRQGSILSTDMYKVYNNKLLDRLDSTMLGIRIGGISCAAPTCADDTANVSKTRDALQTLVSVSVDYSEMEHYCLQPVKSVVLSIPAKRTKEKPDENYEWNMRGEPMPNVSETMHMGIMRSPVTEQSAVKENTRKARRTLYSLMSSGLHGENGLDPETAIHLMQTYVLPVLVYGIEVALPTPKWMDVLEKFNKKFLKLILSLPVTAADPAVYVISGTLPVEATVHKRVLTFYGNICRLPKTSVEHQLAVRQLSVKTYTSHSWFIAVKEIFMKYSLPDPFEMLSNPPTKLNWKTVVNKHVNGYWEENIKSSARLYSSLSFLNCKNFKCGKRHPIITTLGNIREVPRVSTKLKLVTGTYILQTNRATFNQNKVNPTCLLCGLEDETVSHFLLRCSVLDNVRNPIMDNILSTCKQVYSPTNTPESFLQLILDCSDLTCFMNTPNSEQLRSIEFHCRRLCHSLYIYIYTH